MSEEKKVFVGEMRPLLTEVKEPTPGPWRVVTGGATPKVVSVGDRVISEVCTADYYLHLPHPNVTQTDLANAALIASAPELREALEAAQAWMIALQESAGGWWKHPNGSASLGPVLLQINAALAASKKEV